MQDELLEYRGPLFPWPIVGSSRHLYIFNSRLSSLEKELEKLKSQIGK